MTQATIFEVKEDKGAKFSEDGKYRFALWRIWDASKPLVMFIGLNPSKAGSYKDDPTIESVRRIAKFNGYGGFYMMNCWDFISTEPKDLIIEEPNNFLLKEVAKGCKDVVFAWGNFKIISDKGRDKELIKMFPNAKCINQNKNGSPGHPLFKKGETKLIDFKPNL